VNGVCVCVCVCVFFFRNIIHSRLVWSMLDYVTLDSDRVC
jgi:hypothetical protein